MSIKHMEMSVNGKCQIYTFPFVCDEHPGENVSVNEL